VKEIMDFLMIFRGGRGREEPKGGEQRGEHNGGKLSWLTPLKDIRMTDLR